MRDSDSISRVALKKITPDASKAMGSLHAAAVSAAQAGPSSASTP
ncbi:hypothetical protein [Streptomyces sp. TLI_185]|nr:hypothetical protein EDD92_5774 [Streptomyces sp. TLI_185]